MQLKKNKNRLAYIFKCYPHDTELQQEEIERLYLNIQLEEQQIKAYAKQNRCEASKIKPKVSFKQYSKGYSVVSVEITCCQTHKEQLIAYINQSDYHFND